MMQYVLEKARKLHIQMSPEDRFKNRFLRWLYKYDTLCPLTYTGVDHYGTRNIQHSLIGQYSHPVKWVYHSYVLTIGNNLRQLWLLLRSVKCRLSSHDLWEDTYQTGFFKHIGACQCKRCGTYVYPETTIMGIDDASDRWDEV